MHWSFALLENLNLCPYKRLSIFAPLHPLIRCRLPSLSCPALLRVADPQFVSQHFRVSLACITPDGDPVILVK